MGFLYILQSESSSRFYVGSTDCLNRRMAEHLRGKNLATRGRGPWKLVHSEQTSTLADARRMGIRDQEMEVSEANPSADSRATGLERADLIVQGCGSSPHGPKTTFIIFRDCVILRYCWSRGTKTKSASPEPMATYCLPCNRSFPYIIHGEAFMRNFRTRIVVVAIFMVIVVSRVSVSASDWQSNVKKTWEFKLPQGQVKVALLIDPAFPKISSLEILYEDGARPSVDAEGGFIRDVVQQLPSLGVDIGSLHAISMRGFAEPEVVQNVAVAALHSKDWTSRALVPGGAERVVEDLLNSAGVYNAFNRDVDKYGMVVQVQGVENVATARCMDLKLGDPYATFITIRACQWVLICALPC